MRFYVRTKIVWLYEEWNDYLHARLAFALARFGCRILDTTASLTDLNGLKGGMDKQCRLVKLRPRSAAERSLGPTNHSPERQNQHCAKVGVAHPTGGSRVGSRKVEPSLCKKGNS